MAVRAAARGPQCDPVQLQQGHASLPGLLRRRRGAVAAVGVAGLAAVPAMSGLSPVDEAELRRLRWRCRRGMKELDQLLNRWLDQQCAASSEAQRGVFLQRLDCEEDRLWRCLLGHDNAPDAALDVIGRASGRESVCKYGKI